MPITIGYKSVEGVTLPLHIEHIIFNDTATIIIWSDKTKTIVKCHNDEYSQEQGVKEAILKKLYGGNKKLLEDIKNKSTVQQAKRIKSNLSKNKLDYCACDSGNECEQCQSKEKQCKMKLDELNWFWV